MARQYKRGDRIRDRRHIARGSRRVQDGRAALLG